jgi:lipopolysaccharide transport system permease protein
MNGSAKNAIGIYRPNRRHEIGWWTCWIILAANVYRSRELIWQLFRRDFIAEYKKSFVGYVWRFISPIAGILPWVILQRTNLLRPGDLDIPFPAYALLGTTMWGLFGAFYGSAKSTLASGGSLIHQVQYAHEAMLFKQTASQLASFAMNFVVCLVVLMAFGVMPSWRLIFFPLVALPMFFLGAGVGLLFSMISIVAVDVDRIMNYAMGLLIWTMPIIYSSKVPNPVLRTIIKWNPLTYMICSARDIVIYGRLYGPRVFFCCAAGSLLLFLIAWRMFFVSEDKIIERII